MSNSSKLNSQGLNSNNKPNTKCFVFRTEHDILLFSFPLEFNKNYDGMIVCSPRWLYTTPYNEELYKMFVWPSPISFHQKLYTTRFWFLSAYMKYSNVHVIYVYICINYMKIAWILLKNWEYNKNESPTFLIMTQTTHTHIHTDTQKERERASEYIFMVENLMAGTWIKKYSLIPKFNSLLMAGTFTRLCIEKKVFEVSTPFHYYLPPPLPPTLPQNHQGNLPYTEK